MKLGVVATSYPRFPGDPAGNFVAAHVAALRALGHVVDVIAAGDPGTARGSADGIDRIARIASPLFYRGGAPDALERTPLRSGLAAATFAVRMTAAVTARARGWDAIVAHWLAPSALAALPSDRPLTAIAHGGDVFTLRRLRLLGPVLAALARRRARLAFVSAELRDVARRAAPGLAGWLADALVQPMGIDLARFAAVPRAPSDPPVVLCAARLVPIKGVDVALAAMHHVRAAARLVIAGDGPERPRLAAAPAASAARLPTFLGEVTTERRDQLLGAASLVVVPSRIAAGGRTEGTPAIALEALAAGVPVVASAVGGLRSLGALPGVDLVPPEDPRALAAAIERGLARSHAVAPAAMRAAVAHLDWRDVAPRLLHG